MPGLSCSFRITSLVASILFAVAPQAARCQQSDPSSATQSPPDDNEGNSKHIFGIIPNYRTSPSLQNYEPISIREKFKIARQDALDPGTVALAAVFAGVGQLDNSNRSFGQGVQGYAHRWATSYADFAIGDYMTEALYPWVLHQDPRYFRRGKGNALSRVGYAFGQIVLTHGDSGRTQFNFSEVLGNSTSVAISQAYYPDNRNVHDAVSSLGTQLLVDALSNTLKEFWPDLNRKLSHHRHSASSPAPDRAND
jgi:hypothetical protein